MAISTTKNTYVNARVNSATKARAERVLKRIGLSTTDAVNLLLHNIVLTQGVPFDLRIPNEVTAREMRALDFGKGERYAGSTKNILDELLK